VVFFAFESLLASPESVVPHAATENIMAALSARAANDLNFNDIVGSPSILFPSTER